VKQKIWTKSNIDEVLGCLWLICAFSAYGQGAKVLACFAAIKSIVNLQRSLKESLVPSVEEIREHFRATTEKTAKRRSPRSTKQQKNKRYA